MKIKEKIGVLVGLVLLSFILILPKGIYADENTEGIKVLVNGNEVSFTQMPVMENERTLAPYKEILQALGTETTWDDATKTITAVKGNINLQITVGKKDAVVNGNNVALDVPPTIINENVYIPIRFVSENLGYTINKDNETQTIYIDQPIDDEAAAAKIEEYMNIDGQNEMFSGALLVMRSGKVVFEKSYGMANYELNVPNTIDTKFRIGSMTKAFTAVLIMQLQEKGLLNVNDKVAKYLPNYPNGDKITLHNLLSHTSGIPDVLNTPDFNDKSPLTPEELINTFKDKPLDFKPGSQYEYSNSNYFLLGYIIEKITGQPYETALNENILKPLNMNCSGYEVNQAIIKNRASGYSISNEDVFSNPDYLDMSVAYAAGAMYSTVSDLYKWDRALYEEKLLKKESLQKIFTPNLDNYGYGWVIEQSYGRKTIWHDGAVNGFSSIIARYTNEDICIIMLQNNDTLVTERASRDIAAILFGEKYENPKLFVEKNLNQDQIMQVVGQYQLAPDNIVKVYLKDNRLYLLNQYLIIIHPLSETEFYAKCGDVRFVFTKDNNGEINGIDIDEYGLYLQHAKKIE